MVKDITGNARYPAARPPAGALTSLYRTAYKQVSRMNYLLPNICKTEEMLSEMQVPE